MPTPTFVQTASGSSPTQVPTLTSITKGDLLIAFCIDNVALNLPHDSAGNTWNLFQSGVIGGLNYQIYWAIAAANYSNDSVNPGYNLSGTSTAGTAIQYTGITFYGLNGFVSASFADLVNSISCGPLSIAGQLDSVVGIGVAWQQPSGYTSSSGSTTRSSTSGQRSFVFDNLSNSSSSYTETGSFSGTVTYGSFFFTMGIYVPSPPAPPAPTGGPSSGLTPVQIFGRLPNGKIAAVSVDTYGNLAISGGTGGALNTVDVLGNGQATPAMVYGVTPSGKLVAVAVDANGNLCATVGSGGGNPNTTVDISAYTTPTPVQVVGREPTSGKFYAVPLNGSDALYDSVNPGTTTSLSIPGSVPRPIVLCGRAPNGSIVAVALDSSGRLCISGSGSSGSVNTVDVFKNGAPLAIQLFGINASGQLAAVPLDANGNLQLS